MKKIIILAVVAIILGAGGYFAPSLLNKTHMTDGNTYRNEEFGFEVVIPGSWNTNVNKEEDNSHKSTTIKFDHVSVIVFSKEYWDKNPLLQSTELMKISENAKYVYVTFLPPEAPQQTYSEIDSFLKSFRLIK